jgi:O-acetyl-ADP-ribose deacetylase (regulator of RNase III)
MERRASWNGCEIYLHHGDITTLGVDAIVNAANSSLMGGGGVDGAIHRRGGPRILEECKQIIAARGSKLPTGKAVITTGGNLSARFVIHIVGPVYGTVPRADAESLLRKCYRNSLALMRERGLRSIAFPCISTGAYRFPSEPACTVAAGAVRADVFRNGGCDQVVFCTFENADFVQYEHALARDVTAQLLPPRSVLLIVQSIHRLGYERVRIAPSLGDSAGGGRWCCNIVPVALICRKHGAEIGDWTSFRRHDGLYPSFVEGQLFHPELPQSFYPLGDDPDSAAEFLLQHFPGLREHGLGSDSKYVRWYAQILERIEPQSLIYASHYADAGDPQRAHKMRSSYPSNLDLPEPPPGEAECVNH